MLFDLTVKEHRYDLFNRERVLEDLWDSFGFEEPLVMILGCLGCGKSSVVKVFLEECEYPYLYVNCNLLFDSKSALKGFVENLSSAFNIFAERWNISRRLVFEKPFSKFFREGFLEFLNWLDSWAGSFGFRVALVFDDAFLLPRVRGVDFKWLFSRIYEFNRNITVFLVGPEIVYRYFLSRGSLLYGKFVRKIIVKPFDRDLAYGFLERGFREQGLRVYRDVLEEIVNRCGGVVKWLTFFGYWISRRLKEEGAVDSRFLDWVECRAYSEAVKGVEVMLSGKGRSLKVLKALAVLGEARRGEVAEVTGFSVSFVSRVLRRLEMFNLVRRVGRKYSILDPIVRRAFKSLE